MRCGCDLFLSLLHKPQLYSTAAVRGHPGDQLITVVKMTGPSGDNDSSDSRGDEWLICLCSAPESSAMV